MTGETPPLAGLGLESLRMGEEDLGLSVPGGPFTNSASAHTTRRCLKAVGRGTSPASRAEPHMVTGSMDEQELASPRVKCVSESVCVWSAGISVRHTRWKTNVWYSGTESKTSPNNPPHQMILVKTRMPAFSRKGIY